jgi:YD repeat-containing protein
MMHYVHSRSGRLLRYTDVLGQVQHYEHDATGRMVRTEVGVEGSPGHVKTVFTYNDQGLMSRIQTVDTSGQQSLTIRLEYDAQGRETLRVFDFGDSAQRLSQTWNGLDQVERRLLSEGANAGGAPLRDEQYEYELRGRLEFYTCTGPLAPVDPYGKTIQEQEFYFDALDNLEEVRTRFAGGRNIARFIYNKEDPVQLGAITNNHADYPNIELNYDANGNLLQDREFQLGYDSLGRLETVSTLGGGSAKTYGYDGEDTLSNVRGDAGNEQLFYRGDEPATYSYRLIRPAGQGEAPVTQLADQELENVKGMRTRTLFDGLSRAIKEEQYDVDNAGGQPPVYRAIYEAAYNALGELTTETEIDWLERKDLRLTSRYTYDLWGQQDSVTGPDGVKTHTRDNPITFTREEWIEGMGKTVTVSNRFEKPVSVERLNLSDERVSLHSYKYDGLGRTASEMNAGRFETQYRYDAFDRMIETTLPDRAKVVREYAGLSREDLPTLISVNGTVLGTQKFDGLERMIESVTGGRVTTYEFDTSNSQPDRVVRPSGDVIAYPLLPHQSRWHRYDR